MQSAIVIDQLLSQMTLALVDPISYSLISVVVGWAAFLFCGYGLLSRRHPMSYVVLVVGASGIASAICVIADLTSPFSGVFRGQPSAARRCAEGRRGGGAEGQPSVAPLSRRGITAICATRTAGVDVERTYRTAALYASDGREVRLQVSPREGPESAP
jgi:hypothetical protein